MCAYALNTGIANGKHKVVIYTPESTLFPPLAGSNLLKTKHSDFNKKYMLMKCALTYST